MIKSFLRIVTVTLLCASLTSCANMTPAQRAALQTLTNVAQIAVNGVATYYGGPLAGQFASSALFAVGQVAQAYAGGKIPAEVLNASPGISGTGAAVAKLIAPDHVVTQATVDAVNRTAEIAKTLEPAIVRPVLPVMPAASP